ncbi:uncharacterized protein LOC116122631 [Pistacia vera]|uniref:uncharacterized protein LOC116122631 n=1 Tax=Pistacia vera TaxID=55513 RepID=UPI0012634A5B|nr:uncharacterized protein LOC116122631 [Pistacia vera]
MNFNFGGPSHLSSSNSSSFSDNEIDDEELMNDLEAIDAEQEAIIRMRANNNLLLLRYLNQQNNQVIHRGSIPGHRVINRNWETVDRNLFNNYFANNPRCIPDVGVCLPADATDEYIKLGESTTIESLKRFCRAVVEVFAERYLKSPNANDVARLLHIGEQHGFPGMLGSLDCSNNDINVLEASHMFVNLTQGIAPPAHYIIQGK